MDCTMKRLFFILLASVWTALTVFAQSQEEEVGMRFFRNKQYKEAVPYLQTAAKAGSGVAQATLGEMYEKGLGVSKNYEIAMNMYKRAEESHEPAGVAGIGGLYEKGLGVPKDAAKAFSYYKRAADMGSAWAEYLTGLAYMTGKGTEKNVEEGVNYLERSTTAGYGNEYLGMMYYYGEDVPQDYKKAMSWYTQGNVEAYTPASRFLMAEMYYEGKGTPVNFAKSLQLLDQLRKEEFEGAADAYAMVYQAQKEAKAAANKVVAPQYPGGREALFSFLRENLRKPYIAIETAGYGSCSVDFIVTAAGNVTGRQYRYRCNVKVDEEVMRLAGLLGGWKPATKGGRPVNAKMRLTMSIFPAYEAKIEFLGVMAK